MRNKLLLFVTNRKNEWDHQPFGDGNLRWHLYEVDDSKEPFSYTEIGKSVTQKTIPKEFAKKLEKDKKALLFVPGARSYKAAVDSSFRLQQRLSVPIGGEKLDANFIGFSLAIEPGSFPEFIQKHWYEEQRKRIEAGVESFQNLLAALTTTLGNTDINIWCQSAGSVLVRMATNIQVGQVLVSGSALGANEFVVGGDAGDLVKNSKSTTIYYAKDDGVLKIVDQFSGYGSLVGLDGPNILGKLIKNVDFVDCNLVNKIDGGKDAFNHFAYEMNPLILGDIVQNLNGKTLTNRVNWFPIDNPQQSWLLVN